MRKKRLCFLLVVLGRMWHGLRETGCSRGDFRSSKGRIGGGLEDIY